MKISFLGAARQVTGSCFLLEGLGQKILIELNSFLRFLIVSFISIGLYVSIVYPVIKPTINHLFIKHTEDNDNR